VNENKDENKMSEIKVEDIQFVREMIRKSGGEEVVTQLFNT
jgi:hypothetical protein